MLVPDQVSGAGRGFSMKRRHGFMVCTWYNSDRAWRGVVVPATDLFLGNQQTTGADLLQPKDRSDPMTEIFATEVAAHSLATPSSSCWQPRVMVAANCDFHEITVAFLQISRKPQLRSWNWLHFWNAIEQKFPTIYCLYGNVINFPHTSRIHFC